MSSAAPLVETTEDRLRRELSQSSQAEARESLLREECARLRADNRALRRAEARRLAPPSAALYGPATRKALEGPLLTGGELVVASKERTYGFKGTDRYSLEIWLRNNGLEYSTLRRHCFYQVTVEKLVSISMSRSWRAALRDVLPVHRSRLEEYGEVARELYAARDRAKKHRRDLGYESDC